MADSTMTTPPGSAVVERAVVLGYRASPAQHLQQEMTQGSGAAVALREVPFLTQIGLRAVPGTPAGDALEAALGTTLPRQVGEVTGTGDPAVLWLSPDEFLAVGPDEAACGVATTEYAGRLADALGSEPGQVVDLSANRTTLELHGPRAQDVLDKSCQLDLHPREFAVGRAAVTLLETSPVLLWRTEEQTWRVMPRASFATHVVHWLLDGMKEYL